MTDVSAGFRPPCWCPSRWAPAWRLHTDLYKFSENVSPDIFHNKNCCDLNLGKSLCTSSFFLFPDSDLIYWTVLIFYFDLFWMAWHWKPAIILWSRLAGHKVCIIIIIIVIIIIIIIIIIIVSITKFTIVIGSPRACLSYNRCAITWVPNYRCPIGTFCNWQGSKLTF